MTSLSWAPASWARLVPTNLRVAASALPLWIAASSEVARQRRGWGTTLSWMTPTVSSRSPATRSSCGRGVGPRCPAMWPALPDDVEYEQCGTIWVAADEEEMAEVRRKHSYYAARRVPTEVLDA